MGDTEMDQEEKILFPYRVVPLTTGQSVTVKAWDLDVGAINSLRVIQMQQRIQGDAAAGTFNLETAVLHANADLKLIVRDTLGCSDEELAKTILTFEDFLAVVEAVWETSIAPAGGGGVLPKLITLLGASAAAMNAAGAAVPQG